MARQILICAGSPQEGGRYAARAGLRPHSYRVVHSAGQIRGIQFADVHILPSFLESIQRHAILGALQWGRSVDYFYVDPTDFPTVESVRSERAARIQRTMLGDLDSNTLEEAYAEHAGFDQAEWEADRRREYVLQLSPEDFARLTAELDKPAEPNEKLQAAVKKAAAKPRAVKKPAAVSTDMVPDSYWGE